ncbi:glycosyltransferase family 1 protein [Spiractinospora alimapuensis]|nr:glycosyltransferase family 1 protein [Spiractinospora alimapuensis]
MRVAIVAESFLPQVNGVTNSVRRIAEHLRAGGHEVLIIAPGTGPAYYAGAPVVRVPSVPMPIYRSFAVGLPTRRLLTAALRSFRPDVVHLASPALLSAAAVDVARDWALPTVAVFQTDLVGMARHYGVPAAHLLWPVLRRVHSAVDRTLVPSSATMAELRAQGFPRLELWPRGVDIERFSPAHRDAALRRELSPDGRPIIGYVGRLAREKRVTWLAHVARSRDARLVIVGDGPQYGRLRRALPDAVFTGQQTGALLSRLHASFDVFVHTGPEETFCQSVQEALASGVPVVAPAAGGPLDLVQPEVNGLLYAPDSVRSFQSAVRRLVRDPTRRQALAHNARPSVHDRTWSAVNEQLIDLYLTTIARSDSLPTPDGALVPVQR